MEPEFVKCISAKANRSIYQFYDTQSGQYFRVKRIQQLSSIKLDYYQQLLTNYSNFTKFSQLQKREELYGIEANYNKKELIIKCFYINYHSLAKGVKEICSSYKTMQGKQIATLAFDLLNQLINDGNRSFIPTQQNIFISQGAVQLNYISFAGLNLTEFEEENMPKLQFLEISAFLYMRLLENNRSKSQKNYVMIKQRAFLIFVLSLINTKQIAFLFLKQMSEKLSFKQMKSLLQVQRSRIKTYFSNKNIINKISQFEDKTKLSIMKLIDLILIKEEEISWPHFMSQLIKQIKHQNSLQNNLHTLARSYWHSRSQYQKKKLIINGLISLKSISQEYDESDTDLLLTKLIKVPMIILKEYRSFADILFGQSSFSMLNYNIWVNFNKLLLQHKQRQKQVPINQSEICYKIQSDDFNSEGTQKDPVLQSSPQDISLFTKYNEIDMEFLLKFSKSKLSNKIDSESKKITINHNKLSALNQYSTVFR